MPGRASFTTHVVDIGEDEVVKRFRSWDRGEHLREWQGLMLLASYAPGLAPEPLSVPALTRPSAAHTSVTALRLISPSLQARRYRSKCWPSGVHGVSGPAGRSQRILDDLRARGAGAAIRVDRPRDELASG